MHNKKIAPLSPKETSVNRAEPIKSVGLLLDMEGLGMMDKFQYFRKELGVADQDFEILACLPKKHEVNNFEGVIFTPAEMSWLGRIKAKEVSDFMSRPFDLLLVYHRSETKTLNLVKMGSRALLKAGRQSEGVQVYDLEIITAFEEVDVFLEEVKKYLKIINKIN